MQFEYDPERLIEEVKKRPGIWDYEHPDYRVKSMRFQLWREVVGQLMQSNIKLSKSELRELEIQLQKKWKSIRDCFQKYVMRPNKTRRPYIYFKQLQFLLKEQEFPQKDDGQDLSSDSEDEEKLKKIWRPKKKLKLIKDEEETSDDENGAVDNGDDVKEDSYDGVDTIAPNVKFSKSNRTHTDEFAFASVDGQIKLESEDPEKLFLLSLLPHLRSVPDESKLNVKMELMQVLRNANYATANVHKII